MRVLILPIALIIILGAGLLLWRFYRPKPPSGPIASSSSGVSSASHLSPTQSPTQQKTAIFYPMTNYPGRITERWYGKYVTASDRQNIPCGATFVGYHTGDDLEVTPTELKQPVPVFAIADGTVKEVGHVSGYGGLIVIEHQLDNQTATAYYGHINLTKTNIWPGQQVAAGSQISILGSACSSQTDGERKHLHFAIHKGSDIDVRGYVQAQAELAAWLNPKTTLAGLQANQPIYTQ